MIAHAQIQFLVETTSHAYYVVAMHPSLAFDISETARLIRREANRRAAILGSTRAQWRVLARLKRSGDGLRQVELAEALDVEPITLSRMIDRLEEAGLVERRRDPADRRAWRIHLTLAAAPVIAELGTMTVAFEAELLDGLGASDRERLAAALTHIRENLARLADERAELEKAS